MRLLCEALRLPCSNAFEPCYVNSWFCGIDPAAKSRVLSDKGKGQHVVCVGYQDHIHSCQIDQVPLWRTETNRTYISRDAIRRKGPVC